MKYLYSVYLLAVVYFVVLASSIKPDVFFQGDGGMKFMVVKQLAKGEGFKYLDLPQPQWVKQIWDQGYFPIKKPFLYPSPEGYVVSFPPAFQAVSAFFYGRFGYRGLYIIPILSTFLLWVWFGVLLLRQGVSGRNVAIATGILIFCSPLTIYGATYWEHMPAVLLLFSGISYLVRPPRSKSAAILMGVLSGLAIWLRPEALLMVFLFQAACLVKDRRPGAKDIGFAAGIWVVTIIFFVFNKLTYGALLGAHGNQVLEEHSLTYKILRGFKYGLVLNWLLVKFFPFLLLVVFVLYGWLMGKRPLDKTARALLLIIAGFAIVSPFMFPNTGGGQWGPRYFLPLIPPVLVLGVLAAKQWAGLFTSGERWSLGVLTGLAILYCLYLNTWRAGEYELRRGYSNRITPALAFVRQQAEPVIVVNTEHISMEMGAIFQERNFFLAEDSSHLSSLMGLLKAHGTDHFLYINENDSTPGLPNLLLSPDSRLRSSDTLLRPADALLRSADTRLLKQGRYFFGKYGL